MAGLELHGMEELMNKLEDIGKKANKITKTALEKGIEPILNETKATSAWSDKTGELRSKIEASKVKTKKGSKVIQVGVWNLDRAYYLEYGTSKMRARPYLNPSFQLKKGEAQNIIKAEIKRGLGL